MGALRGAAVLAGFAGLTLPLMPVQALLLRVAPGLARRLPHWYHRQVCRLIGVRLDVDGAVAAGGPVLLVSNHTSWLDIPVLSAVAPVSFVAKREVGGWPGVGALARLQRTVFVDREARTRVGETAGEITERLAAGDAIVLFAEGTSSDGNRVLPFRTSLFAAVKPTSGVTRAAQAAAADSAVAAPDAAVQTVALVYTRRNGLPLARHDRPAIGWYGDMEMLGHAWALLKDGPVCVAVRLGPPRPLSEFPDRKALARASEDAVRRSLVAVLRGRELADDVEVVAPPSRPAGARSAARGRAEMSRRNGRWT